MVKENGDPKSTAYTVTVDASSNYITTGISAHDRALTCRWLADVSKSKKDFIRPGHIVPLRARQGGVLERAGHTEAAVDFCRLIGLQDEEAVGVIAELVEEGEAIDGKGEMKGGTGMLRRDGCLAFAKRWGLMCVTIDSLVEHLKQANVSSGTR